MLHFKACYRLMVILLAILLIASCEKDEIKDQNLTEKNAVLERIKELGFDLNDVVEYDDYYLVEGDIAFYKKEPQLTDADHNFLKHASSNNLAINGTFKVFLEGNFSSLYSQLNNALDATILAYNNLNSALTFQKVSNKTQADIVISCKNDLGEGVCGIGGFPIGDGRPHNSVMLNENYLISR